MSQVSVDKKLWTAKEALPWIQMAALIETPLFHSAQSLSQDWDENELESIRQIDGLHTPGQKFKKNLQKLQLIKKSTLFRTFLKFFGPVCRFLEKTKGLMFFEYLLDFWRKCVALDFGQGVMEKIRQLTQLLCCWSSAFC